MEDLAAATNELTRILVHQELRGDHFRDATGIACKALNNLYHAREFSLAFDELHAIAQQECASLTNIFTEVDHFSQHFLRREFSMLEQEFKIDNRMLAALQSSANELRVAVLAEHPQLLTIKQRISSLRDDACAISTDLKKILDGPSRRNRLTRYGLASIGGVAIIANNTPIGHSYFSPAGAAASWKLGTGLITLGWSGLSEKLITKIAGALS